MKPPTPPKKVPQCIGVLTYYRDICARSSHKLVILTNIRSSKNKFK